MAPIFRWGLVGTPVGGQDSPVKPAGGQQWMSWVHVDDIAGLYLLALDNPEARGPINGTSPDPSRNKDFSKALAKVLKRFFLPFGPPDLMLGIVLGEVAQVVTRGQKVLPVKAGNLGYTFQYPELFSALRSIFARNRSAVPADTSLPAAHAGHH
jgi:NAD dependent epimerase/dehydratase family enzyme